MRTAEQIAAAIAETQQKRAALCVREKQAAEKETAAREHLAAVQSGNVTIISKHQRLSTKNTDWLFGALVLLVAAAAAYALVYFAPFLADERENLSRMWENKQIDLAVTAAFALLTGGSVFFLAAGLRKVWRVLAVLWAVSAVLCLVLHTMWALLLTAVFAVVYLLLQALRKALCKDGNLRSLFVNKKHLSEANLAITACGDTLQRAIAEKEQAAAEVAAADRTLAALTTEQQGAELYAQACEATAAYPEAAVKAYGMFLDAYRLTGEMGQAFFDLRERMEQENGETLYQFALAFCAEKGDTYTFLWLLQLAVNKGFDAARSALGKALTQISDAAGSGDYAAAYAILQPLIDAGSTDALNIKLQLDNNRIAENAREEVKKARKAAERQALEQNARLSAAQQAVLREMTAMRQNQEFSQFLMLGALEDARRNGVKVRFDGYGL